MQGSRGLCGRPRGAPGRGREQRRARLWCSLYLRRLHIRWWVAELSLGLRVRGGTQRLLGLQP